MSAPILSPIGPEELRRHSEGSVGPRTNWDTKHRMQFIQEEIIRGARDYAARVGADIIIQKRRSLEGAFHQFNEAFGSTARLSLQSVEAMLICLSSVPQTIGMDLITRNGYVEMCNMLHAIRLDIIRERDMNIARGYPQSTPPAPGV